MAVGVRHCAAAPLLTCNVSSWLLCCGGQAIRNSYFDLVLFSLMSEKVPRKGLSQDARQWRMSRWA